MDIVQLEIRNVMAIQAVRIAPPHGKAVVLGGDNGAGKSSVLDSIMFALGGSAGIPAKPIRDGESEAFIEVNLGECVVTRRITQRGQTLEVRDQTGGKIKSPQAFLDALIGPIAFDPVAFCREPPAKQADVLLRLAGVNKAALEQAVAASEAARREANRIASDAAKEVAAFGPRPNPGEAPGDEADIRRRIETGDTIAKLAADARRKHEENVRSRNATNEKASTLQSELADLDDKRMALQKLLEHTRDVARRLDEEVAESEIEALEAEGRVKPTADLVQELDAVRRHAAIVTKVGEYDRKVTVRDAAKAKAEAADAAVEAARGTLRDALAKASYPLEGLRVDTSGEVRFRNVPLEQCSSGERIRVAAQIAMALNPTLRLMLVRDGAFLDDGAFAELVAQAETNGHQLWIERVGDCPEATLVIEDGEVKEVRP